jgi:hypothetical protein
VNREIAIDSILDRRGLNLLPLSIAFLSERAVGRATKDQESTDIDMPSKMNLYLADPVLCHETRDWLRLFIKWRDDLAAINRDRSQIQQQRSPIECP